MSRTRRPNITIAPRTAKPGDEGGTLCFTKHEFAVLKLNTPGPSGDMGGYQHMENILVTTTDRKTLECVLSAAHLERLERYIKDDYGPGGPNKRMRLACRPAIARMRQVVEGGSRAV